MTSTAFPMLRNQLSLHRWATSARRQTCSHSLLSTHPRPMLSTMLTRPLSLTHFTPTTVDAGFHVATVDFAWPNLEGPSLEQIQPRNQHQYQHQNHQHHITPSSHHPQLLQSTPLIQHQPTLQTFPPRQQLQQHQQQQASFASSAAGSDPVIENDHDRDQYYHYGHQQGNQSQQERPKEDLAFDRRVKLLAQGSQKLISIADSLELGLTLSTETLLRNSSTLTRELPVRFSRRILELKRLPAELRETTPIQDLIDNYSQSLKDLLAFSDTSRIWFLSPRMAEQAEMEGDEDHQRASQKQFVDLLEMITHRHKQDVVYMAHGISLFKRYVTARGRTQSQTIQVQKFLNAFNKGRLALRIMIGHHMALHAQFNNPLDKSLSQTPQTSKRVGIIEPQCDIEMLVKHATQSAQFVFFQHYNTIFPPNVHIEHAKDAGGRKVRFPVVPALLHHILFELLKNSMRATAEFHGLEKDSYPDIIVQLVPADKDKGLTIRIKDNGGGLPEAMAAHHEDENDNGVNYMFTTASSTVALDFPSILTAVEKKPRHAAAGESLPLCGFGFGLATSKLYAKLFNGNLTLHSLPGFGTEATIRLPALEDMIESQDDFS